MILLTNDNLVINKTTVELTDTFCRGVDWIAPDITTATHYTLDVDPPEPFISRGYTYENDTFVLNEYGHEQLAILNYVPEAEPLTVKDYDNALIKHFDSVAQQKTYDNRLTCAMRSGYVGPYQRECTVFSQWMDNCNVVAFTLLNKVTAGDVAIPTIDEFIASLPVIDWNAEIVTTYVPPTPEP